MPPASLDVSSPAWRAGRASACIGALLDGRASADDLLDHLAGVGAPPQGWWEVLGSVRAAGGVVLLLPRSGDPRGLALPREVSAEAALGWPWGRGGHWLICEPHGDWTAIESAAPVAGPPHPDEALRALRQAVVDAAHFVDDLDLGTRESDPRARQVHEVIIDSWVLGPPPLPTTTRHVAALGLRMLLSLEGVRDVLGSAAAGTDVIDATRLEQSARSAVESAFSRRASAG